MLLASVLHARNSRYAALVLLAASDFLAAISLVYHISNSLSNHIPNSSREDLRCRIKMTAIKLLTMIVPPAVISCLIWLYLRQRISEK